MLEDVVRISAVFQNLQQVARLICGMVLYKFKNIEDKKMRENMNMNVIVVKFGKFKNDK